MSGWAKTGGASLRKASKADPLDAATWQIAGIVERPLNERQWLEIRKVLEAVASPNDEGKAE